MANDAALRANFDNFMYDLQGTLQRLFPRDNVFLAELSGVIVDSNSGVVDYAQNEGRYTRAMDSNREHFDGEQVRFPIMTSGLQAGGFGGETTSWNEPIPIDNTKATVKLAQWVQPFALSIALERDSKSGSRSAMSAVEMYTTEAYASTAWAEDVALQRNGDAKLAANSGSDTNGLVVTVGTSADWDVLLVGNVYDVLKTSDGSDPGNGLRRKIASVDHSAGTVTFSTTQQASDGGFGNITLTSNTVGIYLPGSYGNAPQGIGQAVTVSGTPFEGIDVANTPRWTAQTVAGGSAALTDAMLLKGAYLARGQGAGYHDFGIAHPAVVDDYITSKSPTVYYQPQETTLRSGFSGIVFQGADRPYPIVKALNAPRKKCRLIRKDAVKLYGDSVGPAFIDDDGSVFRFFSRKTVKEADLLDRFQLAVMAPNKLVEITALAEAYTP